MNFEVFWKNEGLMFESIISPKTSLFLEIFSINCIGLDLLGSLILELYSK